MKESKSFATIPAMLLGIVFCLCMMVLPAEAQTPVETLFELDGNLIEQGADDWGQVDGSGSTGYVSGPSVDVNNPGGNAAISSYVRDVDGNGGADDIFTGGGSKDDLPINGWKWTYGSAPDKDDLMSVGAAAYYDGDPAELLIYDFGTLYAANGSSSIGNWFFIKDIGPCENGKFGVVDSSDEYRNCLENQPEYLHTKGDVLIISENTNGGTVTNISVYKWVAGDATMCTDLGYEFVPPKKNLCLIEAFELGTCGVITPYACGKMNQVSTESVDDYNYMSKFPPDDAAADPAGTNGITADDHPAFTFFESGINISRFLPDAECFASFMKNTRTSASPRSQLKDFAGDAFPLCGLTVAKSCPKNREAATGGYCEVSDFSCASDLDCGVDEACVLKNPQFLFGDTVRTQFAVTIGKEGPANLSNVELTEVSETGCEVVAVDGAALATPIPLDGPTEVLASLGGTSTLIIECDTTSRPITQNTVTVTAKTASGYITLGPETADMLDETCQPTPDPGLNLAKECDGHVTLFSDPIDGLMFRVPVKITVSNTGNEDLNSIKVVDQRNDGEVTIADGLSIGKGDPAVVYDINYETNVPDDGAIPDEWLGCEVMFSDTAKITQARGTYSGTLSELPPWAPATCVFCEGCVD